MTFIQLSFCLVSLVGYARSAALRSDELREYAYQRLHGISYPDRILHQRPVRLATAVAIDSLTQQIDFLKNEVRKDEKLIQVITEEIAKLGPVPINLNYLFGNDGNPMPGVALETESYSPDTNGGVTKSLSLSVDDTSLIPAVLGNWTTFDASPSTAGNVPLISFLYSKNAAKRDPLESVSAEEDRNEGPKRQTPTEMSDTITFEDSIEAKGDSKSERTNGISTDQNVPVNERVDSAAFERASTAHVAGDTDASNTTDAPVSNTKNVNVNVNARGIYTAPGETNASSTTASPAINSDVNDPSDEETSTTGSSTSSEATSSKNSGEPI